MAFSGQFPDCSVYADELLMFMRLSESNFHRQFLSMPTLRMMAWNNEKGLHLLSV